MSGFPGNASVPVNDAGIRRRRARLLVTRTLPGCWNVMAVTCGLPPHGPDAMTDRVTKWLCQIGPAPDP